jgi:hypothetical protein
VQNRQNAFCRVFRKVFLRHSPSPIHLMHTRVINEAYTWWDHSFHFSVYYFSILNNETTVLSCSKMFQQYAACCLESVCWYRTLWAVSLVWLLECSQTVYRSEWFVSIINIYLIILLVHKPKDREQGRRSINFRWRRNCVSFQSCILRHSNFHMRIVDYKFILRMYTMLSGLPVTTAWSVLRLRMEETASRYEG